MNSNEVMLKEIEEHERWLADRLPAESPAHEHLKLRLQVEVQEQWLASRTTELLQEEVSPSLRSAVRQAVAASRAPREKRPARTWKFALQIGLGIAAMLALAVPLFWSSSRVADANGPTLNLFAYDTEEQNLDVQLEDTISELEDLVAARDDTNWDTALEEM